MPTSETVTQGVRVRVESRYHPERSRPAEREWFFSYTIHITNEGGETVQLLGRRWVITDAEGRAQVVRGPGVVGKQPVLAPGESFEYTSFCPLTTEFGTMHGSYRMVTSGGVAFDVEIAPFALGRPYSIN